MKRKRSGFTLLEVIVSMTILVTVMMICYQILGDTLEVSEQIDRSTRPDKIGKAILALFRRDLQGTLWYNMGDEIFLSEDLGDDDSAHDQLHFFTSSKPVNSQVNEEEGIYWGGVTSVSYVLENSRDVDGAYTLFRRECVEITDEPFVEGVYFELYNKIAYVNFSFFDGFEWRPSWDSSLRKQEYEEELEASVQNILDSAGRIQSGTMSTVSERAAAGGTTRTSRTVGGTGAGTTSTAGLAGAVGTGTGEELYDLPLPERGIPRAVRIELGIMAGSENGLYRESFEPDAPVMLYHYSAMIHLPASESVRISSDIADSLGNDVQDLSALESLAGAGGTPGAIEGGRSVQGGPLGAGGARGEDRGSRPGMGVGRSSRGRNMSGFSGSGERMGSGMGRGGSSGGGSSSRPRPTVSPGGGGGGGGGRR